MSDKFINFEKDYSDDGFWDKCKKYVVIVGKEVMELVFKMYYFVRDLDMFIWVKSFIYVLLGYFIVFIDVIFDLIFVMGFIDDYGVLIFVVGIVVVYIK